MSVVEFPRPRLLVVAPDADGGNPGISAAVAAVRSDDVLLRSLPAWCDPVPAGDAMYMAAGVSDSAGAPAVDGVLLLHEQAEPSQAARERFLTLLFASARLREVDRSRRRAALSDFQAAYKYLLLAADERGMRELGRIVADVAQRPWTDTMQLYRERFARAIARPATTSGHVNALTHAFGHLSDRLSHAERMLFLDTLDDVAAERTPIAAASVLLRSWIVRFDVPYLSAQAYFRPYPSLQVR